VVNGEFEKSKNVLVKRDAACSGFWIAGSSPAMTFLFYHLF